MAAHFSIELFTAAGVAFIAIFLICCYYMSTGAAYTISVIKVSVPLLYFGASFDGTWTFLDDWRYLSGGREILQLGFNPILDLFSAQMWHELTIMAGGSHTVYYWWNAVAQSLLGHHYWAPVLLNLVATAACGLFGYLIACRVGYQAIQARSIGVLIALHWELISWSSFANLKDCLVALLTLMALWAGMTLVDAYAEYKSGRFSKPALAHAVCALALALLTLMHLRFYIVPLYILAISIWLILFRLSVVRLLAAASLLVVGFALVRSGLVGNVEHMNFSHAAYGWLRFMLTPRPWATEDSYSFLAFPVAVSWLTFPIVLYGGWQLLRRSRAAGLLVMYSLILTSFYAVVPLLQGPRHRIQLIPVFCIFLVEGAYRLLSKGDGGTVCGTTPVTV